MNTSPLLTYIIAGKLQRNYILLNNEHALMDVPGGGLLSAAAGLAIWDNGIGLVGRVGEDYPQDWLDQASRRGFDLHGIHIFPESLDLRNFIAYIDHDTVETDNPVAKFAQRGLPFPKALLEYNDNPPTHDSRIRLTSQTLRLSDIPSAYLDATAAHLCPMDFISHSLLPPTLKHGHINTITLDPSPGYMHPTFWDDIPVLLAGVTAFHVSEKKLLALFLGRSTDLWEMAEAMTGSGCEIVVIKQGSKGQLVFERASHNRWIVPAYPVNVVDPTGAGDAFSGGFLAGYHKTYDAVQAVLYGNISASFAIEGTSVYYPLDTMPGLAEARRNALKETVRKV
jgi:sugar/nucleoside kinase (ribokinase family)